MFLQPYYYPGYTEIYSWFRLFFSPGAGFGSYQAVDFALVMDVLPVEKDKAKDLAVWHQVRAVLHL